MAGELAVIDPGGEAQKIISEIKKLNANVVIIINTHGHFDHTLADNEIKKIPARLSPLPKLTSAKARGLNLIYF